MSSTKSKPIPKHIFVPSFEQSVKIKSMAALGISHDLIAKRMGIPKAELLGRCRRELIVALPEMKAMVGASLFAKAKAGDLKAIIFWLKTRAGWCETIYREVSEKSKEAPRAPPGVIHQFILPCNARNPCPRLEPELYIAVLERMLHRLVNWKEGDMSLF